MLFIDHYLKFILFQLIFGVRISEIYCTRIFHYLIYLFLRIHRLYKIYKYKIYLYNILYFVLTVTIFIYFLFSE